MTVDRSDWPIHQPGPAYEAPIPGLHWYGGCEPGYPRVNPETGLCEGCGEAACRVCGKQDCGEKHPELEAASQRLMDTLGVRVVIDPRAERCARDTEWLAGNHGAARRGCERCAALDRVAA